MTKAHSEVGDNDGRCEMCNRNDGGAQQTVPVMLGGGLGMGTMWKCERCIQAAKDGVEVEFDWRRGIGTEDPTVKYDWRK